MDLEKYVEQGLNPAREFHEMLGKSYHPNTYVYCGEPLSAVEHNSIAKVTWQLGRPPSQGGQILPAAVSGLGTANVEQGGGNLLNVWNRPVAQLDTQNDAKNAESWRLIAGLADAGGDGTVPTVSGRAPATQNPDCVRQQVRLADIEHEGAYHDSGAQDFVYYAIAKIARKAKLPASQFAPSRPAGTVK